MGNGRARSKGNGKKWSASVARRELAGVGAKFASLPMRAPKKSATVGRRELERIRAKLELLPIRDRKKLRGLEPQRADIVVAGAIVLEEVMDFVGCLEFTVCTASVREGVLWREAAL